MIWNWNVFFFDRNALEEVKIYLKRNSVTARSLTILDVVHPTTSPIKDPERIQIIDRFVMAKVWDDVRDVLFHEPRMNCVSPFPYRPTLDLAVPSRILHEEISFGQSLCSRSREVRSDAERSDRWVFRVSDSEYDVVTFDRYLFVIRFTSKLIWKYLNDDAKQK